MKIVTSGVALDYAAAGSPGAHVWPERDPEQQLDHDDRHDQTPAPRNSRDCGCHGRSGDDRKERAWRYVDDAEHLSAFGDGLHGVCRGACSTGRSVSATHALRALTALHCAVHGVEQSL